MKNKEEYYLRHPSKQFFYHFLANTMGVLGLNTEVWDWYCKPLNKLYDLQRFLIIIFVPITSLSQILYLCLHYKEHEFATLAVMFCIMPVAFVVLVKSSVAQTRNYKTVLRNYMYKMNLHSYLDKDMDLNRHKFIVKNVIDVEKWTRLTYAFYMTFVMICYCSWMTVPIIHNIQKNQTIHNITMRLEVSVHFWQPFDYEFNFYAYLAIQILGIYCAGVGVALIVPFDTVNLSCIYHLVGHIKILKYDLKFGFTDQSDENVRQKLVDITKFYRFLTKSFKEVEKAFGLNVLSVYIQNLIQGGLLLYQIMSSGKDTETILTFGLMIPIFMGVLLLMSLVLESVRIQAEEIPTLVYGLSWESMSIPNQKLILSILVQVQPTLEFMAAFNTKTGIQPAIDIIKTTFSYYVMISQSRDI